MHKGELLKRAREAAGLSQEDIERLSGYKQSTISGWENGTVNFSTKSWNKIKNILGIQDITDQLPADMVKDLPIYQAYGQAIKKADSIKIPPAVLEKIIEAFGETKKQGR